MTKINDITCPCCNGTLSAEMLEQILSQAGQFNAPAKLPMHGSNMLIDPHAHMIARTTDDYEAMARAGIVAVIEPAFWLGQLRTNVGSFIDYFSTISGFERFRAGQFGIRHYCCIGLNPKEANNPALAEEVLAILPRFLCKEGVVALGEIGYDERTPLEDHAFRAQIAMAKEFELPIMVHTPHRDKKRGTQYSMDVLEECGFDPARCVIDHNNEETVAEVLDRGYWCAFTIYPSTKMGNERLAKLVAQYGPERLIVNSACDWGVSDPLAVPKSARVMADHGISAAAIHQVVYQNALAVYGLNGEMRESHWTTPATIDQRHLYDGNSVLRGQEPRVDESNRDIIV
ncbi:TatD family hydrolase [Solimicrobium silvestre]|uniref:Putative metal-dependent hydrolases with the TIM-barrel fold n=1 Tax=Solimicrobium silvestre TaxID=2099400 RepID=A0A2S9H0C5_9BURK|nr:TatD family hydrolase [Solimicrobium silvestre]PRC93431.1 putative metal-dependent hydrolases with the TIM-barrel fold [Solimicrobium silvestre]